MIEPKKLTFKAWWDAAEPFADLKEAAYAGWHARDPEVVALRAQVAELLAATKKIWQHFESGALIRDTSHDHESDWAIKQLTLVLDLQRFDAAIQRIEEVPCKTK